MRIISANLNGIRSASRKGFFEWMLQQDADVICLQELKAQQTDLSEEMLAPANYQGSFHYAEKKGYSGVGVYTRLPVQQTVVGLGVNEIDSEGRYLQIDFADFSVVSLYMPSGSSSEERQQAKFYFMAQFMPHLQKLKASGREFVIAGDWNIAHQELDLKNWKGNLKNSGFLPEERAWMTALFSEIGFVDVYRNLYPETPGYTWWSNRGQARAKDVGWRIDYQITTPALAAKAISASIYKEQWFSDHAPLIVDYDLGR